jgi:hypothetical protein
MHTGIKNAICILHKNIPLTPRSKWAFLFKHTLAVAKAALLPAAAEAAADGEAMVVDTTAETEE